MTQPDRMSKEVPPVRRVLRPLVFAALAVSSLVVVSSVTAAPGGTAILLSSYPSSVQLDLATGQAVPLPVDGADAVLSPKRDRLAYVRDIDPCVPVWEGCALGLDLLTANPDGTDERVVLSGAGETSRSRPDWSPDGKKIAFQASSDPGGGLRGLAVVNADGSGLDSLDRLGGAGTFSPDGKRLAYVRQQNVYVIDLTTRATRAVTTEGQATGVPDWSPDGKRIVYAGAYDVHSVSAKGGPSTNLLQWGWPFSLSSPQSPVFSPDGSQIAFTAWTVSGEYPDETSASKVFTMNTDGTEMIEVAEQNGEITDWIRT